MKKNHLFTTVVLSLVFVCLMVSTATSQDASKKVWNLKYWVPWSKTMWQGQVETRFVESVKQATGGRVIVTPYWNGSLMSPMETLSGLKNGVFEIGMLSCPMYPGEFPVSDVASLPFLFKTSDEALKALTTLRSKGLMPEYDKVKLASFRMTDMAYLAFAKKEVQKLEDLKGMKIRVSPGIANDSLTTLGAIPVGIKADDIYMSMDRGVVDGLASSPGYMGPQKMYEVTKFLLDVPLWVGINFVGMNLNTWNSFPDDIKAIMEKEFAKQSHDWADQNIVQENANKDLMKKNGVKFTTLSPTELARWKQATQPVEARLIKKLNDMGLQGQKVVEEAKASVAHK